MSRDVLDFPESDREALESYLPPEDYSNDPPWVTVTFAQSLDSGISVQRGVQSLLSGPQSKAMTHYLRSRHDAILVGITTAVIDKPSLNCRLGGVGGYGAKGLFKQPRPIVLDPSAGWNIDEETKVLKLAAEGRGYAPFVICVEEPDPKKKKFLEKYGGKFIQVDGPRLPSIGWKTILTALHNEGLRSVMVEGGAKVIKSLLEDENLSLIESVIVTIAPTWLGEQAVKISLPRKDDDSGLPIPVARLRDVKWIPLGEDVIACGRPGSKFESSTRKRIKFSSELES